MLDSRQTPQILYRMDSVHRGEQAADGPSGFPGDFLLRHVKAFIVVHKQYHLCNVYILRSFGTNPLGFIGRLLRWSSHPTLLEHEGGISALIDGAP